MTIDWVTADLDYDIEENEIYTFKYHNKKKSEFLRKNGEKTSFPLFYLQDLN